MGDDVFHVSGRVVDSSTGRGAAGVRVEAWDRDLLIDDLIGSTETDENGQFQMRFDRSYFDELFVDRRPDLFFRVFRGEEPLDATDSPVIWDAGPETREVRIEVRLPRREPGDEEHGPPPPPRRRPHEEERREHEFEVALLREQLARLDPERWSEAMARKREMPRAPEVPHDPGPRHLAGHDEPGVFVADDGKHRVAVRRAENPHPGGSFGFVDAFATVEAKEDFLAGTLALRFDPDRLGTVTRSSLRLFHWNPEARRFSLVARSGPSDAGDYVFARVTRPGLYAVIGVNADPLLLPAARLICEAGVFARALPLAARSLVDDICTVILCAPELRESLDDPAVVDALLLEGARSGYPLPGGYRPPGGGSGGDLCDRCVGMGRLQLPECEILRPDPGRIVPCTSAWTSVGPANLSGCVKQVVVDPSNSDRLYCASANGGVWVLDQVSGYPLHAWRPLTDQVESLQTWAMALGASTPDVLYAAARGICVFRSDDRGSNWRTLEATRGWTVNRLLVHPADSETV
ncbi:MAG TPA: hypothetical protein VF771_01385, partial [Longimicrobiaceae bacterium]